MSQSPLVGGSCGQTPSCHHPFSLMGRDAGRLPAQAGTCPQTATGAQTTSGRAAQGWWGADLAVVGADVSGIIEVQLCLPAKPPAVQAHILIQHAVEVLLGPQGPHQTACMGSSGPQPAPVPWAQVGLPGELPP